MVNSMLTNKARADLLLQALQIENTLFIGRHCDDQIGYQHLFRYVNSPSAPNIVSH
jgi:hypothetical protein